MSEKLYLPISVLFAALIISGTIFFVGADISTKFSGLAVAPTTGGTVVNNPTGGTVQAQPNPIVQQPNPEAPVDMVKLLDGAHVISGNENSKVTIVEFSDFECPFCGRVNPTIQSLIQEYGDNLRVAYKHFPLSFHPNAEPAANASECAAEQGKFKEYHDVLFVNQTALSTSDLKKYAVDIGLNAEQFNGCLDSSKYASKVSAQFSEGSQVGVSGTPTFFINGTRLVGAQPLSNFKAVIDPLMG